MAYVSTKIKKAAKQAYEEEIVENEYFTITKPEGFISPIKDETEFSFEAYSKDLGEEPVEEDFNQCWATITEREGIEAETKMVENDEIEKGVLLRTFNKTLINKDLNRTFTLEIRVLPGYSEQYLERINQMRDSFSLR